MPFFDGSQKKIGQGAQAVVYLYKGCAYKVYREDYPKEWIQGELMTQREIVKTGLPVVHYAKTEAPNIRKMDYIDGITLGDQMLAGSAPNSLQDMVQLQKKIHTHTNVHLRSLRESALQDLAVLEAAPVRKARVQAILDTIPEQTNLLHLDFHFFNIMRANKRYYIIDWINARIGNPVFDFARSYLLLYEAMPDLAWKYRTLILSDPAIDTAHWTPAVYVSALLRLKENSNEATVELIQSTECELFG